MMCGMVGSGKSFIAKKLAQFLGAVYLSSDGVRWHEVMPYDLGFDYDNLFSFDRMDKKGFAKVYQKLWQKTNKYVLKGKKVVLDATFLNTRRKNWATRLSKKVAGNLGLVFVQTDMDIILKRVKAREALRKKDNLYEPGLKAILYYQEKIKKGEVNWPKKGDAPFVFFINNNAESKK